MRLGPLRHPWFAAFAGSVGLGGIGDEVARLALPLLILDLTHSIAAAASFGIARSARVVGPTIGGLAIAAFGTANAMYIAALAFVPTLFVFVLMPPIYDVDRPKTAITPANIARELGEGFSFVWRSQVLRWLLVLMFIANLGQQGIQTLVLYVLREENRLDEVTIGVALSLAGAVTVLASFIAPRLARGRPLGHTLLGSAAAAGVIVALTALARDWRLVVAGYPAPETAWMRFIID